MKPKTIAILVAVVLLLALLLPNMRRESIQVFFWPIEMPLLVMILGSMILGWIVGWFSHMAYRRGKSQQHSSPNPERVQESSTVKSTPSVEKPAPDK